MVMAISTVSTVVIEVALFDELHFVDFFSDDSVWFRQIWLSEPSSCMASFSLNKSEHKVLAWAFQWGGFKQSLWHDECGHSRHQTWRSKAWREWGQARDYPLTCHTRFVVSMYGILSNIQLQMSQSDELVSHSPILLYKSSLACIHSYLFKRLDQRKTYCMSTLSFKLNIVFQYCLLLEIKWKRPSNVVCMNM